jgi:hypothetical protein
MNRQNVTEPEEDESESASDDEAAKKGKLNPLKVWAKSMLAGVVAAKIASRVFGR